jgi:hypothetical protein
MSRLIAVVLVLAILLGSSASSVQALNSEDLVYHPIETDRNGNIIPWYSPNLGEAYDHNIRLVWDFWKNMRTCDNGVKYYMQHQVWRKNFDDPRGLGGDQLNEALSSWNLLHQYLGDEAVKDDMIYIADYYIEHAFSKPTDAWPDVPYPYNTDVHSGVYDGDMRSGKGILQPDKAASFGAEMITLYEITGMRKYLTVAMKIANTLTSKIKPGDADNSPWPFRVNAETGEVHQLNRNGTIHTASYTTAWTAALRLYDGLIRLHKGTVGSYRKARRMVIDWLKAYPIKTNYWGPFFEDVPTNRDTDTEINADTLAWYILEHPDWDPDWKQQAKAILNWSLNTFANFDWVEYGVVPINEQTVFMLPGNSHTARYASVELLIAEKTGDDSLKRDAIRRLNWATYTVNDDGRNRYPEDDIWLSDGYGDYVRHYLRAMASSPELAPDNQNHLLRTSSVIKSIAYGPDTITYTKCSGRSTERLKLGEWEPAAVIGGEMQWDAKTKVLEIRATSPTVTILREVDASTSELSGSH